MRLFPLWLKRLKRVKDELKRTRWLRAEEGFQQALSLMAFGLEGQTSARLMKFSKSDARWIKRWRQVRGKVFSA